MTGLGVAEQRYTPCIGWSARRTAPACTSRSGTKLPLRAERGDLAVSLVEK